MLILSISHTCSGVISSSVMIDLLFETKIPLDFMMEHYEFLLRINFANACRDLITPFDNLSMKAQEAQLMAVIDQVPLLALRESIEQ